MTAYAIDQLEPVYSFIYARVGNRADAEDLTQQVAMKALPRLRDDAPPEDIRSYLFWTARSALATFWANRFRMPEVELGEEVPDVSRGHALSPSVEAAEWLERTLSALPGHYRQVLELRFLRGCSIREAAREMGRSEGAVKVMQLRALRAAASQNLEDVRTTENRDHDQPTERRPLLRSLPPGSGAGWRGNGRSTSRHLGPA